MKNFQQPIVLLPGTDSDPDSSKFSDDQYKIGFRIIYSPEYTQPSQFPDQTLPFEDNPSPPILEKIILPEKGQSGLLGQSPDIIRSFHPIQYSDYFRIG